MGSLRNPIGPLPSSIYWRRRAVACAVLVLVVLLIVWALGLGGDDSEQQGKGEGGGGSVSTITPGPTDSGPAISDRPGGRDEDDGGSGGGTGGGSGSGGSGGSGGSDSGSGSGSTDEAGGSAGGSAWKPGGSTGGGGAGGVPAAVDLPACKSADVTLKLRSTEKSYGPGEKPKFELTAVNGRGSPCRIDLGRKATTVTVVDAADEEFWTSADCRRGAEPAYLQVPADGEATRTFTWERRPSVPDCGTPPATSAAPGDYELEVRAAGLKKATAPFTLTKD